MAKTGFFFLLLVSMTIYLSLARPVDTEGSKAVVERSQHSIAKQAAGNSLQHTSGRVYQAVAIIVPVIAKLVDTFVKIGCRARANDGNREAFVKELCDLYARKYDRKLNVMVFNMEQGHTPRLHNVVDYKDVETCGIKYRVWAFESGEFINHGDGGYINWCFTGRFHRDWDYVKFYKI